MKSLYINQHSVLFLWLLISNKLLINISLPLLDLYSEGFAVFILNFQISGVD